MMCYVVLLNVVHTDLELVFRRAELSQIRGERGVVVRVEPIPTGTTVVVIPVEGK
jgi:hypothetical protein